jgi:hypothetical protein
MSTTNVATPQQIGKAFVVQYYRLLHEHPESLHRFYSSTSTLMHDDPTKTVIGTELIAKRIEELSLKQRHVKIRQVDCHSTVGSSVVVQVCGEISSTPIIDSQIQPIMKRFVQTFVLTPADNSKQKYYVHNDIFRYQDSPSNDNNNAKMNPVETPITPSGTSNIEFFDNIITEKKDEKTELNNTSSKNITPPVTPVVEQTKPKSYRDAIGKKEKPTMNITTENQSTSTGTKSNKSNKQQKKAAKANANKTTRGHPQDTNDYYDDSWYYGNGEEGYLSTGYTDDQEVFVGNLSAQVTENEVKILLKFFFSFNKFLKFRFMNYFDHMEVFFWFVLVIQDLKLVLQILLLLFVNQLKWQKLL